MELRAAGMVCSKEIGSEWTPLELDVPPCPPGCWIELRWPARRLDVAGILQRGREATERLEAPELIGAVGELDRMVAERR